MPKGGCRCLCQSQSLGRTGLGRTKVQQGLVCGGLASKALRLSSTKGGLGRRDQGWAVWYRTRLGRPRPRKLGRQSLAATAHLRLASKPWLQGLILTTAQGLGVQGWMMSARLYDKGLAAGIRCSGSSSALVLLLLLLIQQYALTCCFYSVL
jgi:hypothetical protein